MYTYITKKFFNSEILLFIRIFHKGSCLIYMYVNPLLVTLMKSLIYYKVLSI